MRFEQWLDYIQKPRTHSDASRVDVGYPLGRVWDLRNMGSVDKPIHMAQNGPCARWDVVIGAFWGKSRHAMRLCH